MTHHILYLIKPRDSLDWTKKAGERLWIPEDVTTVQPVHSNDQCAIDTVTHTLDGMAEWYAEQLKKDLRPLIRAPQTIENEGGLLDLLKRHSLVVASGYNMSRAIALLQNPQDGWKPGEILRVKFEMDGPRINKADMGRFIAYPGWEHTTLEVNPEKLKQYN